MAHNLSAVPVCVWHNGDTIPSIGGRPIWPYTTAAIPRGEPLWHCWHRGSRRRVAPLRQWVNFEPSWYYRKGPYITQQIVRIMDRLHVRSPRPVLPAGLALRLFEMHMPPKSHILSFPHVVGKWAVWWSPVYTIQSPVPCPRTEPYVEVWDLNCAYGAPLDTIPEMSRGKARFRHKTGYHGPWGFYALRSRVSGDQLHFPGTYLEARPDLQAQVERGYVLTPAEGRLAPGFVAHCYDWSGIAPKLMRRLPVLLVGKTLQHSTADGQWQGFGACYPPIWAWVTGWLRATMERTMREHEGAVVHAYIDALHLRKSSLHHSTALGEWKLAVRGEGRYLDLNTYVIEGEDAEGKPKTYFKRQSLPGLGSRARATFEQLWAAAKQGR